MYKILFPLPRNMTVCGVITSSTATPATVSNRKVTLNRGRGREGGAVMIQFLLSSHSNECIMSSKKS